MTARKKPVRDIVREQRIADREAKILFVDSNDIEFVSYRKQMGCYGLSDLSCAMSRDAAETAIGDKRFDIVMIELPRGPHRRESLSFLSRLRGLGYRGIIAMIAEAATLDLVYRCARLGASEFLLKTDLLDMGKEISRLLSKRAVVDRTVWQPKKNLGLGLFSSAGLTKCEIQIVEEFARGFPKHSEIARRLGKSEPYIRKNFSRIYNKLGCHITVENSAQLSHLITVCSLYT